MTTYKIEQGLRLALMKLENSASSVSGSKVSQIVNLRHPEERMAARLVERKGLTPPIDVEKICRNFGELSFKNFPIEIDGICLDLKVSGKKPKVWVSTNIPPVRRRFTIAHEIGHIVIPWHHGTIVDDLEAANSNQSSKYREMEAEANRFAAELLMPTVWALGLAERSEDGAALMHSIRQIAGVSYPAAFIKTARVGRPGIIAAEVKNGVVVRSIRTPETHSRPPIQGLSINDVEMPAATTPRIIQGPESQFFWWNIRDTLSAPLGDLPPWRDILNDILLEIPPEYRHQTRQSVNAVVGLAIGREPRGGKLEAIYKRGIEEAQNREDSSTWTAHVYMHSRFKDYVLARARERADKN